MNDKDELLMYAAGVIAMMRLGTHRVAAYNDLLEDEWQGRQSALEFLYKSGDILSVLSGCSVNCGTELNKSVKLESLPLFPVIEGVAGVQHQGEILCDNGSKAFVKANVNQLQSCLCEMVKAVAASGDAMIRSCDAEVNADELAQLHSELKPGNYCIISILGTGQQFELSSFRQSSDYCFAMTETGRDILKWTGMAAIHDGELFIHVDGPEHGIALMLPQVEDTKDEEVFARDINGRKETILLVDDEDMIWDVVLGMLKDLGYNVLLANDGQEAVDIYRENAGEIDLVLMDMLMPVMNAREAFPLLKQVDENVRVLLASGYVDETDVQDLLANGAMGFMRKPYSLAELAKRIRGILDKEHR